MDFDLGSIKNITDNFSEERKVGSGGYGDVYRGMYNGKEIAVKVLHPLQGLSDQEFHNEFHNLAKIHHPNIIELIGYCYQSEHKYHEHQGKIVFAKTVVRVLCFEYMPGGSLQRHIGDESCVLDWPICYRIIKGICAGLNHLHNAKETPILHLDLKPGNILLHENMEAKIADLGSSRLSASPETQEAGTLKGTRKYMPPECKEGGKVSNKYDVFSLGVIILDIVAGYDGYSRRSEMAREVFIELVCAKWKGRPVATSTFDIDKKRLETCVGIALVCVEDDPNKRPDIKDVLRRLEELEAQQRQVLRGGESGPSHQPIESAPEKEAGKETEAPKETAENCFGNIVDSSKLDELARYMGKPKTQEDRARVAWSLITDNDKKGEASRYVDFLKQMYGNGQSTLCLVYNATGDTLKYVTNHDWYGYIGSRVGYPAEIGNGQWAAFHHVHREGEPSGSVGAVVYRGKKKDGLDMQDYMLAWSTPWGFYYRNKAYVEIVGINYFQRRWDDMYVKLVNSDYSSKFKKSGGCLIEAAVEKGDSPKYTATIKADHSP